MKNFVIIVIMILISIQVFLFSMKEVDFINSYALDFSRDGRISFLVDSRRYFSIGLPFAGFFRLEMGYPWSWIGFELESSFPFPSVYSNFGVDLAKPTEVFAGDIGMRYGVNNWYFKSGVKFIFAEFIKEEDWSEVGRFYYFTTTGLNINDLELKIRFLYHFLSSIRDEEGNFNYNFPSPVSADLLSMNELELSMNYTLFTNEVVNMTIGAGYRTEFSWSNFLSEALYRPENFYIFIRFGIAGDVFH